LHALSEAYDQKRNSLTYLKVQTKMKFLCSAAKIAIYFSFTVLWMALFINASQNNIIKMTDEWGNAVKVGNYIQAIEQFSTIRGCPKTIRIGMVMKVKEIDDDGNVLIRYGYYANEEDSLVSKKDTNKFVNLELEVFSTGITKSDLQGNWVNSLSFYFTVEDTLYTSMINENVFEIKETENEFILNQWVLMKKSKTLTWKKGNQEVFWYPTKMQKGEINITKDKNEYEQKINVQNPISYFQGNSNEIQSQAEEQAKILAEEQAKMFAEEKQIKMREEKEEREMQHALWLSEQDETYRGYFQGNFNEMQSQTEKQSKMLAEPKVGDYIQSIEEVETITKDQLKHIPCSVVMKIEEIDHDGDFLVRYGYYANKEVLEWVSKQDTNKFVNLMQKGEINITKEEQAKILAEQIKMREEKEELEMQHALWLSGTAELTKGILSEQEQRDTEIMNHALCVLCLGTFVNPTQITCGHTFCADCLQHLCNAPLLEGQNVGRKPCPTCRVDFDTNTNYAVNVEFRNQIEHMNNNNNNANQ